MIYAQYTSVWDDGVEVTSRCAINNQTKEIESIENCDMPDGLLVLLDILVEEYVTINGRDYYVEEDENGKRYVGGEISS